MMSKDFSPILHAISAITLQCAFGLAFDAWGFGGALGCLWFIAREHTQAEDRWITKFGNSNTAAGYYQAFLAAWMRNDPKI